MGLHRQPSAINADQDDEIMEVSGEMHEMDEW